MNTIKFKKHAHSNHIFIYINSHLYPLHPQTINPIHHHMQE